MTKEALKDKTIQGLTFFGKLAMVIGSIAMLLISAPLFIAAWLINAVKSFFITTIMWCLGKFGIFLLLGGFLTIISNVSDSLMSEERIASIVDAYIAHAWGTASQASPSGSWGFFSYPTIEFTIIIVLTIIMATKMTVNPDDF